MKFVLLMLGFILMVTACSPQTASRMVAGKATAVPGLIATAQADQYWRDAEATTQVQQMTVAANFQIIQSTAHAATSTIQAQQTRDALNLAITVDAATAQAVETQAVATAQAEMTATAQAQLASEATSTTAALATNAAFQATRQTLDLQQAQARAQREQTITVATTAFIFAFTAIFLCLAAIFFWKIMPTLIRRFSLVRYGQHGNPLMVLEQNGETIMADPLRMLQASMHINRVGETHMPTLTPNEYQMLVTGGVLQTLVEQARQAPGHRPQLPAETVSTRQVGPVRSSNSTRYTNGTSQGASGVNNAGANVIEMPPVLPSIVSWQNIISHSSLNGLALGMGVEKPITLNLAQTPHILLSGSSGAGKTRRALRPLVAQALAHGVLVIMLNESGADFAPFYDHPNAILIHGDVQTYGTVLEGVLAEMNRREQVLRQARVSEWRRLPSELRVGSPPLLLVIDEILSLTILMSPQEQKQFWGLLAAYASRARKLSMGSIGALTDPTYRILGAGLNWREQCNARITFRVAKSAVSRAVLDEKGAEALDEGQFLAMLGTSQLLRGVAAHPDDAELQRYLTQHPSQAQPRPSWLPVADRGVGADSLGGKAVAPQPGQPVATSGGYWLSAAQTASQPVVPLAIQSAASLQLPLDTTRPPTAAEQAYMQRLGTQGMSKNAICRHAYGFKDGKTYAWVTAALQAAAGS